MPRAYVSPEQAIEISAGIWARTIVLSNAIMSFAKVFGRIYDVKSVLGLPQQYAPSIGES